MEEKKKKSIFKRWWFWVIVVIIIIAAASGGGEKAAPADTNTPSVSDAAAPSTETDTAAPSDSESQPAPAAEPEPTVTNYKSGQYKVGTDLAAGEYVIISDYSCYFEIAKDSKGTLDSIVANDNFVNRTILTVSDGQYLKFNEGTMYAIADAPAVTIEDGILPAGMYKVGVDVKAGEYKVVPDGSGYVEVSKDSKHVLDGIISNDNLSGEQYVTISDGQYIKMIGAYLLVG